MEEKDKSGISNPAFDDADLLNTNKVLNDNEKNAAEEYQPVSFLQLFRYASSLDKINIVTAIILSILSGPCYAAISLTFGKATGSITDYVYFVSNSTNQTEIYKAKEQLLDNLNNFVITNCTLGVVTLMCAYISILLFNYSALNQSHKIRELFLFKILNQDMEWFDVHQTGDFASRVTDDLRKIEEGIGDKVAIFIFYETICVWSILQAFIIGWKMTLVCLVAFPLSSISVGIISSISSKFAKQEAELNGRANAVVEEVLSAIRTVVAFSGQEKEEERYSNRLRLAKETNIRRLFLNAIARGLLWLFSYAGYALSLWYGVSLILGERYLPEDQISYGVRQMITIYFCVLTATYHFGMASPFIETFGMAKGAAAKIFAIIESQPKINESKGSGIMANALKGNMVFEDVYFCYPSRKEIKVLQGFNLLVKPGETVALVGRSGCGKSTCVKLIQRFYDPTFGHIYIDGNKLTDLNLTWFRNHVGVVSQEPVLFEATIAENIKYGYQGATHDDIEKAARKADAHNFISCLPEGYNTMVGERGTQLSGGQKQRIAIARALIRNPTILILDEATSALDVHSESAVQIALDLASNECTTIIIAHRLSTIKKADKIVFISEGIVREQGSHEELMSFKGEYYDLIKQQVLLVEDCLPPEKNDVKFIPETEENIKQEALHNPSQSKDCKEITKTSQTHESVVSLVLMIMKLNSSEWWIIAIGCISSVITGAGMPIYCIALGDIVGVLSNRDEEYIKQETNTFSLYILSIGIIFGIATFLHIYTFGISGEKLTMRLRRKLFKAMLSQQMAWFDYRDNKVGALCARLSGETANVQGAAGQLIGAILNAMSTAILAISISAYFEWRVTLVCCCFVPIIIFCIFTSTTMTTKGMENHYKSLERSTSIAVEAISNISTVVSLGCETILHNLYMNELVLYQNTVKKSIQFRSISYAIARSIIFFAHAAAFYYGGILVRDKKAEYANVFIGIESLLISSWCLANALVFAPNVQRATFSAYRTFELLKQTYKPRHCYYNSNKWNMISVQYENIYFSYPTRPTVRVLKGLDLLVPRGKKVALVGSSGCGKSTIVGLLERFYNPTSGKITSDEEDLRNVHMSTVRSNLGIVLQEPHLFSRTIAENIAYGDNFRTINRDEIIAAAKKANIHNFINSLPLGYDTKLGEKGTQLSGGQKQRVAIARALVRNPKILILDEATSALDAESEKVVQEALNNAREGRTSISIAHRLSAIQDADIIYVMNNGRIAERGTHSELLSLKGIYYNLHGF